MKRCKYFKTCFITFISVTVLLIGSCGKRKSAVPATSADDTPKYGGTLNLAATTDIQGWDHAKYPAGFLLQLYLIYDTLLIGDWSKGQAGTGEVSWNMNAQKRIEHTAGEIAERFEIPEPGTFIFHLRHGVHFAVDPNNPASRLAGGREVTADDVVFSMKRQLESPMSFLAASEPEMAKSTAVTKIDKWTVKVKTPLNCVDPLWLMLPEREIVPPEIIKKFGDLSDWHAAVGTGPFMAADYVPGSTVAFVRNTDYWGKDPAGPGKGNQLPYIDAVQMLVMPDVSTQLAALRTGKVDQVANLSHDDAVSLMKTNPELKYDKLLGGNMIIAMRTDKKDLPYKDKRVRQALTMAIDFDAIKKTLDGGDSEILAFPLANIKGYENAYMPMEEMPDSVKELYSYNVKKAKQLLAESGYPNGFKAKVTTWNFPDYIDYLSLVKDMWAEIGVDLTIQPLEFGAYMGQSLSRNYEEMMYSFYIQPGPYAQLFAFRGQSTFNRSWVSDPRVDNTYNEIIKYNLVDQAKVDKLHRDIMPYVLEQAWYIPRPAPYMYTFWQPWVRNYHGELALGYNASWPKYVWIDQKMKEEMTGQKPAPVPVRKPASLQAEKPAQAKAAAVPGIIDWKDAGKHVDKTATVKGPCVGVLEIMGMNILQIGSTDMAGFGASLADVKKFKADIKGTYVGKTLQVSGKIVSNGVGGFKIDVSSPSQIVIK